MTDSEKYIYTHYTIEPNIITNEKIKDKIYKNPKDSTIEYQIINYDDKFVCDNDKKLGVFRSVVLTGDSPNKLVCFTPPKSLTFEKFVESNAEINDNIYVNEIIEGTMMSLFYDERMQSWEIASKSAIGGNYWFFRNQYEFDSIKYNNEKNEKQPTFRRMFLDAMHESSDKDINDICFLQYLPKDHCYNFILQHPANHIVMTIPHPVAYLVSVYQIVNDSYEAPVSIFVAPTVYEEWDCFRDILGIIEFPKRFQETTYESLEAAHCSIQSTADFVGLMITNLETGERTSIENPVYRSLRDIRGNHPNLQYQYLCLRRIGKDKIMEFVHYFPQYKEIFYKFYKQFADFVTNVHQSYVSYYVKKQGQKISKQFFPIIYKIHHDIYLQGLNPSVLNPSEENLVIKPRIIIKRDIVKTFIENMSPIELIYYLNYTNTSE